MKAELFLHTENAVAIGDLFKLLSKDSKAYLAANRLPLESFVLRHRTEFAVFKNESRTIMVSRAELLPLGVSAAAEVGRDDLFSGKEQDPDMAIVHAVLHYIPNDWAPFVSLGVPDSLRKKMVRDVGGKMKVSPKQFMERFPKFFECKAQNLDAHTFLVRRSPSLQEALRRVASGE